MSCRSECKGVSSLAVIQTALWSSVAFSCEQMLRFSLRPPINYKADFSICAERPEKDSFAGRMAYHGPSSLRTFIFQRASVAAAVGDSRTDKSWSVDKYRGKYHCIDPLQDVLLFLPSPRQQCGVHVLVDNWPSPAYSTKG
jgi:hypothetical protein